MVRAILARRKTQTRRLVTQYVNPHVTRIEAKDVEVYRGATERERSNLRGRHFGAMGPITLRDPKKRECELHTVNARYRLGAEFWGRETFRAIVSDGESPADAVYAADYAEPAKAGPWTPSIHMPRWAARITGHLVGLRAERLQAITPADARAEGCGTAEIPWKATGRTAHPWTDTYCALWESINGVGSWEQNPWVWVLNLEVRP